MSTPAILIKITGTLFHNRQTNALTRIYADNVAQQLKQLQNNYTIGIVIGGGSFFRGSEHNTQLHIRPATAHSVGMLATSMSSLILYDILHEHEIPSIVLNAFECTQAGTIVNQQAIDQARANGSVIIFGGGTGNPFVTTDTCAVIRAQQLGASMIWKATDVDGIYSDNPHTNANAHHLTQLTHQEALDKQLQFMDHTALILAKQANITIKVFNVFEPQALIQAATNAQWGSTVQSERNPLC